MPLAKVEMSFEDFLFLALVNILFNGVEPLQSSWIFDGHNFSSLRSRGHPVTTKHFSYGSKRPKVWEETSKINFQDGSCGDHLGFSIGSFSYFVSTRCPNAHHQVMIQMDYRGDV